jgi:hypothetical protein
MEPGRDSRSLEIQLRESDQIFDLRDPSPFRERDLDPDFEEYVMGWVEEHSLKTPLRVRIVFSEALKDGLTEEGVRSAFRKHFDHAAMIARKRLRSFLKSGQGILAVGVFILFVCIFGAQQIDAAATGFMAAVREALHIFGWVSLWKPIELALFDWYPYWQQVKKFEKVRDLELEIQAGSRSVFP